LAGESPTIMKSPDYRDLVAFDVAKQYRKINIAIVEVMEMDDIRFVRIDNL